MPKKMDTLILFYSEIKKYKLVAVILKKTADIFSDTRRF